MDEYVIQLNRLLLVNLCVFGSVALIGDIYLGREGSVVVASLQVPELSDLLSVSCVDK